MTPERNRSRTYFTADCVVFLKTNEAFGGLSNMAGGFPLRVNGLRILTSEALYQACRFPHLPEVQRLIIGQTSPMTAKMKSKPYRKNSRPDWEHVRIKIMRWCLRVKLVQNWTKFSDLLLATRDCPIVEESRKDDFWGAKRVDERRLIGTNILGRLLMELREEIKSGSLDCATPVTPLAIPDFLLNGRPIEVVMADRAPEARQAQEVRARARTVRGVQAHTPSQVVQTSLFEQPVFLERQSRPPANGESQLRHMTGELKPYPAYKDSGVPWLGELPEHWTLRRAKTLLRERNEKGFPQEPLLAATQTKGVVRKEQYENRTVLALKDLHLLKLVRSGDFVISLRSFQGGIEYAREQGIISPAYTVLYPSDPRVQGFLAWLFKSRPYIDNLSLFVTGIRQGQNIDFEKLSRAELPLPPLAEQAAIVRFLDHADRRIRRYIRAKQRLIALLNEQKQAIIHRAVTRGLDPAVPLKPSGVTWLGDVPEHWEVMQLRRLIRPGTSITYGIVQAGPDVEGGIPYIRTSDMKSDGLAASGYMRTSPEIDRSYARSKVATNDLVVAIRASLGRGLLVPPFLHGANLTQGTARVSPGARLRPRFLFHAFNSRYCQENIQLIAKGTTFLEITLEALRRVVLVIPPLNEQDMIIAYLDQCAAGLDSASVAAASEIALLREYRTRLIADVVTGQLDVREAAATLPESEPDDDMGTLIETDTFDHDLDDAEVMPDEDADAAD